MPRGRARRNRGARPAVVHRAPVHRAPIHRAPVHRAPVVVHTRPPIGSAIATGMIIGATVGMMSGAGRRSGASQTKVKQNKIIVMQPFPGTLAVLQHKDQKPEFHTFPPNESVPANFLVLLAYGQKGTPTQLHHNNMYSFSVIPPGNPIPKDKDVSIIVPKLIEGTLVEYIQDGKTIQTIVPPGNPFLSTVTVLLHPDGKDTQGNMIQMMENGIMIRRVIPLDQPIPTGATVVCTVSKQKKVKPVAAPPASPVAPSASPVPPPPTNITLKSEPVENVPSYAANSYPAPPAQGEVPSYLQGVYPSSDNPVPSQGVYLPPDKSVPAQGVYPPPPDNSVTAQGVYPPPPDSAPAYAQQQPISDYQNYVKETKKVETGAPPSWVPDEASPFCKKCESPFTLTHRRHHCRNCGDLLCSDCTKNEIPLPQLQLHTPSRVCNECYQKVSGHAPPVNQDGDCILL